MMMMMMMMMMITKAEPGVCGASCAITRGSAGPSWDRRAGPGRARELGGDSDVAALRPAWAPGGSTAGTPGGTLWRWRRVSVLEHQPFACRPASARRRGRLAVVFWGGGRIRK